jgi:hypothetical protein
MNSWVKIVLQLTYLRYFVQSYSKLSFNLDYIRFPKNFGPRRFHIGRMQKIAGAKYLRQVYYLKAARYPLYGYAPRRARIYRTSKYLLGTNTLAYFVPLVTKKRSFETLSPRVQT